MRPRGDGDRSGTPSGALSLGGCLGGSQWRGSRVLHTEREVRLDSDDRIHWGYGLPPKRGRRDVVLQFDVFENPERGSGSDLLDCRTESDTECAGIGEIVWGGGQWNCSGRPTVYCQGRAGGRAPSYREGCSEQGTGGDGRRAAGGGHP